MRPAFGWSYGEYTDFSKSCGDVIYYLENPDTGKRITIYVSESVDREGNQH